MYGVDHYGGDTDAVTANSFEECREICDEKSHCKRWTYQTSKHGACFLKKNSSYDGGKFHRPNLDSNSNSNLDVHLCFKCKTGFRSSSNVKCSNRGKMYNLIAMKL